MDFSYEYTDEQQRFREQVSGWLDANLPENVDALLDSPDAGPSLRDVSAELGRRGWLAPSQSAESGGAGLSPDQTVVILEELNRRGLLWLVDGEAQSLRQALGTWDSSGQKTELVTALSRGTLSVWRHRIALSPQSNGEVGLDPDSVGIMATPDADGYLLNGSGMYAGYGSRPGHTLDGSPRFTGLRLAE